MLRSRSLDLSFIRRGRKRSAIRSVSQAFLRFIFFQSISLLFPFQVEFHSRLAAVLITWTWTWTWTTTPLLLLIRLLKSCRVSTSSVYNFADAQWLNRELLCWQEYVHYGRLHHRHGAFEAFQRIGRHRPQIRLQCKLMIINSIYHWRGIFISRPIELRYSRFIDSFSLKSAGKISDFVYHKPR